MSIYQKIASTLLAGSLLAGTSGTSYAREQPSIRLEVGTTKPQSSSAYRSYIQSYIAGLRKNYGDLIPKTNSLSFALNSEASDSQLFAEAMELYGGVMNNYQKRQCGEEKKVDGNYHLVPFQSSDGSAYFTDLNGHGRLKIIKNHNGLYSYIGSGDIFEKTGGRGLVNQLMHDMEDDYLWKNKTATQR